MMNTEVTLRTYVDKYTDKPAFLPTYYGSLRIEGVTKDWNVVTGQGLSQRTFTCHPDRRVIVAKEK